MPFLDPERLPEVAQAVDLSQERPKTAEQARVDVQLDVQTQGIGVKASFAEGSLVARAFSFLMVGGGAAGVGVVISYIASTVFAMVATAVTFAAGLIFVDRWRGK